MSAHDHTTRVPGCFRCEMSGDELGMSATGPTTPGEGHELRNKPGTRGYCCSCGGWSWDRIKGVNAAFAAHAAHASPAPDAERGGESIQSDIEQAMNAVRDKGMEPPTTTPAPALPVGGDAALPVLTHDMLRDPRTITMMVLRGLDGSEMPYSQTEAAAWLAARDAAIAREAAERALRVSAKDAANHYTDDSATGYAIWLWNTNYADALAASLGDGSGT